LDGESFLLNIKRLIDKDHLSSEVGAIAPFLYGDVVKENGWLNE
jgi:hypothetical protein